MRRFLLLALILVSLPVQAADVVVISGPTSPIEPREPVELIVTGLTESEIQACQILVTPSEGVRLKDSYDRRGRWTLDFWAKTPGKYTVAINLNTWRSKIDVGLFEAKQAQVKPDLLAELETVVGKIATVYPSKSGTCVVEVAGPVPFPEPGPGPNPNPAPNPPNPSKVTRVTFIYEKDTHHVPRPVAFALQRINAESAGSVVATEFEKDTRDGAGQVPDQYAVALEAARKVGLPALVVQAGNSVVRVVKSPTTEQAVLEASK